MGRGAAWSAEDWTKLGEHVAAGKACPAIARAEGWSVSSVRKAMARLQTGRARNSAGGDRRAIADDLRDVVKDTYIAGGLGLSGFPSYSQRLGQTL